MRILFVFILLYVYVFNSMIFYSEYQNNLYHFRMTIKSIVKSKCVYINVIYYVIITILTQLSGMKESDLQIEEIKNTIYKDEFVKKYPKKAFKSDYADFLKDKNYKSNYFILKSGKNETKDANLSGFFSKNEKILFIYGIQYKNNIYTKYYYDAMGNLRYIDTFSSNYPNYPYFTHQYRIDGSLAGSVYFKDKDTQYIFKNEKFSGVWFKNTMFNRKAKKIMTRSNY